MTEARPAKTEGPLTGVITDETRRERVNHSALGIPGRSREPRGRVHIFGAMDAEYISG